MFIRILKYSFISLSLSAVALFGEHNTRIINGSEVADASTRWNFIVSLSEDGEASCGGTLIAPSWVLTASHCVIDDYGKLMAGSMDMKVKLGNYTLSNQEIETYTVKQIISNPNYDPSTTDNDIALIELSTNNTSIEYFPTIASNIALDTGKVAFVAGWGNLVADSNLEASYPDRLNEVKVPIVDYNLCNDGFDGVLTENMFCAGYLEGGKDSCQGDSGGPLISYENTQSNLIGVVSWGDQCAEVGKAGVYTKVQNYYNWIVSYTGELTSKNSYFVASELLSASTLTKLYVATFNRAPDSAGISYWLDSKLAIENIAQSFFQQPETQTLYPEDTSTEAFVVLVYQNLFNREPDQEGLTYWIEELENGLISKSYFILAVMHGAKDDDSVILENKKSVGEHFANSALNSVTDAKSVMSGVNETSQSVDSAFATIDSLSQ